MTKGYVRTARLEDVPSLAADLREADIAEIKASSGSDPRGALIRGITLGVTKVACLPDDTPVAIFGIVPIDQHTGAIWMVATTQFKSLHRQFLRECRGELEAISADYRLLFNFTDARNSVHHRWIKWLGFTIIKRHETFGHEGRAFLEFCKITKGPPCVNL
jgi:hypothetical protein